MTQTVEMLAFDDIPSARRVRVAPEPVPPISMWELAADAIRAAELRSELGTTAELPAISTEDIRTVCCPDCDGTGNGAPATRDPQDQRHWNCAVCGGTAEVRACVYCGEIVGAASECAACKEEG